MKPSAAKSALQATDREWVDRVSAILSGGATLADQMSGQVRTCRYNSDALPTVQTTLKAPPIAIVVLAASLVASPTTKISGCPIAWSLASSNTGVSVLIASIGGLTASVDYDVLLWIVGG